MKSKLEALRRLRTAKMFVLITDESALMAADFGNNLDGLLMLDALREIQGIISEIIREEEANVGNKRRRKTSQSQKSRQRS